LKPEYMNRLAKRLFSMEEWQVVVVLMEELESELVESMRGGTMGFNGNEPIHLHAHNRLRERVRIIAADIGCEDPWLNKSSST